MQWFKNFWLIIMYVLFIIFLYQLWMTPDEIEEFRRTYGDTEAMFLLIEMNRVSSITIYLLLIMEIIKNEVRR